MDNEFDEEAYWAEWESPAFKHGFSVGEDLGSYRAEEMAIAAYNAGEIDLYIKYITPKSMEDWGAWREEYGNDFENRWKK